MGKLVSLLAASHAPLVGRDWDKLPDALRERFRKVYREVGRRVTESNPDVLVIIAPDHWVNFQLNNLPGVCIGVGESNQGPPEPFLAQFQHKEIPGHPDFAMHLAETAFASEFEPSISYRLILDHGTCLPLDKMELAKLPPVVSIIINSLELPMPSAKRCYEWGELIRKAAESFPGDLRVSVLATGGISHSIGEPTMGQIDEPFDRKVIGLFEDGDPEALTTWLDPALLKTGNGAFEVRNWVATHGAAGGTGFELIDYIPAPEVYVGCAYAAWRLN